MFLWLLYKTTFDFPVTPGVIIKKAYAQIIRRNFLLISVDAF